MPLKAKIGDTKTICFLNAGGMLPAATSSSLSTEVNPVPRRRFQKGRVFQRGKRKKWAGMFYDDMIDPQTGRMKRVRRTVTFDSSVNSGRAARRALQPYLDRVNVDPPYPPKGGKTVTDLVEDWKQEIAPNRKEGGARTALSHIHAHILPLLGKTPLRELNTRMLQTFVTSIGRSVGRRKTVENVFGTLSSILRKGRKWGLLIPEVKREDIEFPIDRSPRQETFSFDAETATRIIRGSPRIYRMILQVAALTALRIGEITALKVSDLDFKGKTIHVRTALDYLTRREQTPKTEGSMATVPMSGPLEKALKNYLDTEYKPNPERYLFTNRFGRPHNSQKVVKYGVHQTMDRLGIARPEGARIGMHCFRRGVSSELLSNGTPVNIVTRLMRHSDSKVTLNSYGKILRQEDRAAMERWAQKIEAQLESRPEMESEVLQAAGN